jgi:hypothetical protein
MPKARSTSSLTASDWDGSAKLLTTLLADGFVLYT